MSKSDFPPIFLLPHEYRKIMLPFVVIGLVLSVIFRILDIKLLFMGSELYTLLAFYWFVFCEEKEEDERVERIRFYSLSYALVATLFLIGIFTVQNMTGALTIFADIADIKLYHLGYTILVMYYLQLRYWLKTNPRWALNDKMPRIKPYLNRKAMLIVGLIGLVGIAVFRIFFC